MRGELTKNVIRGFAPHPGPLPARRGEGTVGVNQSRSPFTTFASMPWMRIDTSFCTGTFV